MPPEYDFNWSPEMETFLSYTNVISDLVMVIVVFDIIALLIMLFLERYDPRVFFTWLVVLILLPPVGFILYMYMGSTIYNRRKFMPKNVTDQQLMVAAEHQGNLLEIDLADDPEKAEMYRMAKALERAGAWSYSDDNDVVLYTDGKEKMDAMFADLRNARHSILIEYYIIRNDRRGNELMDILTQKVREGVEVRLLTDGFGIGKGPKEGIYRFRNAGGHYAMFHSSLNLMLSPKKNNRNHRKIAIIDGKVAYCGGFNIGDEYQGEGPLGHWRDASVRVEGLGILPMAVRFSADWQYSARKDPLEPLGHYLGDMTLPLSMIILGVRLADMPLRALVCNVRVYAVSAIKLIVSPLAGLGVMLLLRLVLPIESSVIIALFIIGAMPTASSALNFAEMYGGDCETAAASTLMSTVLCIATIPVLMLLCNFI